MPGTAERCTTHLRWAAETPIISHMPNVGFSCIASKLLVFGKQISSIISSMFNCND